MGIEEVADEVGAIGGPYQSLVLVLHQLLTGLRTLIMWTAELRGTIKKPSRPVPPLES